MQLDLEQPGQVDLYQLATHLVTPRPIAWVTTQNADAVVNLAPFSYFGLVCDDPILLVLSLGQKSTQTGELKRKDTSCNLLMNGQAVIHFVEAELFSAMLGSSAELPEHQSEVLHLGLETQPSVKIQPPRLAAARLSLECVVDQHLQIGKEPCDLFILRAVQCHLAQSALTHGLPDPTKTKILGKLGGFEYVVATVAHALKRTQNQ